MTRTADKRFGGAMLAAAVLTATLSGTAAAATRSKPQLVSGAVSGVSIRYVSGLLKHEGKVCRLMAWCRNDLALAKMPPALYGAWEARHLKRRLNHLSLVGDEAYPCPLDTGNGYVLEFLRPAGTTRVMVAESGCQWATVANRRLAARWSTPLLSERLHNLLEHRSA